LGGVQSASASITSLIDLRGGGVAGLQDRLGVSGTGTCVRAAGLPGVRDGVGDVSAGQQQRMAGGDQCRPCQRLGRAQRIVVATGPRVIDCVLIGVLRSVGDCAPVSAGCAETGGVALSTPRGRGGVVGCVAPARRRLGRAAVGPHKCGRCRPIPCGSPWLFPLLVDGWRGDPARLAAGVRVPARLAAGVRVPGRICGGVRRCGRARAR
jgi:hypothetical protein